jgi:hypothetical protein
MLQLITQVLAHRKAVLAMVLGITLLLAAGASKLSIVIDPSYSVTSLPLS